MQAYAKNAARIQTCQASIRFSLAGEVGSIYLGFLNHVGFRVEFANIMDSDFPFQNSLKHVLRTMKILDPSVEQRFCSDFDSVQF
jgi:hypothetical protein